MAMIKQCDYFKQAICGLERKLTRPNGDSFDLITFLLLCEVSPGHDRQVHRRTLIAGPRVVRLDEITR
jgi:hypothetical protein